MRRVRGFNLIELLLAIVIISITVGGVLLIFTQTVRFSADPMIQQQAVAIAEGYLDEILARPVDDPPAGAGETGGAETGETRATFDDVKDYSTIVNESPPKDQNGNDLAGMNEYSVTVVIVPDVNIGPAGSTVAAAQVDVTVTHAAVGSYTLTGYRSN